MLKNVIPGHNRRPESSVENTKPKDKYIKSFKHRQVGLKLAKLILQKFGASNDTPIDNLAMSIYKMHKI